MAITDLQPSTSASVTDESCDVFHGSTQQVREVRQALIPAESASALAETFRALGDPTRVRILDALSRAELCVCDIATLLSLGESAVSHQLRLLRSLRLFAQGLEHVEEAMPVSRRSPTGAGR